MQKKKRQLSLRHRLFVSFTILICILLLVLWLTQVVFLEDIHKAIKKRDLERAATTLSLAANEIGTERFSSLAERLSAKHDICVLALSFDRGQLGGPTVLYSTQLHSTGIHGSCVVHSNLSYSDLYGLYQTAVVSGKNKSTQRYVYDNNSHTFFNVEGPLFEQVAGNGTEGLPECILSTHALHTDQGEIALFLNTSLSPVSATTETLNWLLGLLSACMLLAGSLLSFLLAKRLSAPIVQMTTDAKLLASGDMQATFRGHGYKEAEELAEALTRASEELSKSVLLRRELIANVSHDLRTPVTLIAGYSEMIRDIPGENNPENAQILLDEASRLSALISDLMDLSKLEAGVQELERSTFPLTTTLRDAMLRYDKLHPEHTITFDATEDLFITSDQTRVLQILYNLVNNAINHAGEDKLVAVTQSLLPPEEDGRAWVRISVTDHGSGIPKDEIALIWDRYYKVDPTRRRATAGTGLGLSIVRSTTQLLGGRGGVSSTEGEGSTFWFELPLE